MNTIDKTEDEFDDAVIDRQERAAGCALWTGVLAWVLILGWWVLGWTN
jgi:hypothetical protein